MYTSKQERSFFEKSKQLLMTDQDEFSDPSSSILTLKQIIQFHEWKYYVQNNPVISDYEFDILYKKLESLETLYPEWVQPDSPTQRVSSDLSPDFPTVKHLSAMLSLANSYDANDLLDFDKTLKKLLSIDLADDLAYCVEPKFDGGSISLIYENDLLVRAATRGNGQEGDEMTPNAKTIRTIPLQARFSTKNLSRVELRGEAIIRKETFQKVNQIREKQGMTLFANPRNAATGGLRMKDPKETAKRGIEAFVYQISYWENKPGSETSFTTQYSSMDLLGSLGFKVPQKGRKACKNIMEVIEFCAFWEEKREQYPYEIDGMVVKLDELALQSIAGSTSHHPRWAIAYKFKAKQATSQLLNVEYQVGKIGSITPVAKLQPVQLAGVTVSSVSLHNEDFIVGKDLRIGDQVIVERAGDVIPYIVKALPELRNGLEVPIKFPTHCPINQNEQIPLVREQNEAAWRCPACTCGAQDLQRIIFHVSKDAMNIDGFGKSIVERFYDLGWIKSFADIYNLDYEKIAKLEGFGATSALNLQNAINKAKSNPIYRLLHSLSIHHLGARAARIIAALVNHILDLSTWSEENLTEIKDIGPVLAQNVVSYFSNETNIALLKEMEKNGVNLRQTEADQPIVVRSDAPLSNKSILFTGTLQQMGRKEAKQLAELAGARIISAVSSKLDILVVGENPGSKLTKAEQLGTIQILSEEAFLQMVNS
jgi:DNA ligase (NAD+)